MAKNRLDKLNTEAVKTAQAISAHEAGIAYATGQLVNTASKIKVEVGKEIAELRKIENRALVILADSGR